MKKMILSILAVVMILSCLAGCGTQQPPIVDNNANSESSQSAVSEQAYESDEEVSAEERAKEEKERKATITQQYSIYSEFGLTYDSEKDRFFYAEKMVRYFSDQISKENTNSFFYAEGIIDLTPVRDTAGKLTGLTVASDDEFAARTAKQDELEAEFKNAGVTDMTGTFELGNPDARDNTLSAYSDFGISYDKTAKKWMYNGQSIHAFYDPSDSTTYIDYGSADGLNLKVVRNKTGSIEKLDSMTDTEVLEIIN